MLVLEDDTIVDRGLPEELVTVDLQGAGIAVRSLAAR
jgi:hypothetical protein